MNREIMNYLMEINERTARTEEKLDLHVENSAQLASRMANVEKDVVAAKASLSTLRWFSALILITVPSVAAAVYRAITS